ncbi:MAG: bifunctional phosphopantothenoylcysteine decarboxylase/phosphopantothenate--cysteine ligase CoaBC [Flavobacteriaceae bacterium]|nr:MAG: bifunctional phosphopantothenoylcysteine decarboxylase/phosphopantothenate--cysteine ligase CoaBC [Flavobacteriaceae bacterium]
MSTLQNKRILLGVTGGIAAYKCTFLVRLLIKQGAQVKVVMTPKSKEFVTPLSLSTLSKNSVESEFSSENGDWNNHVDLALWADLMLIAPATANTLAKMASGTCDNLLMACYLSAKCPVFFAPAMDLDMYKHPTTLSNLEKLESNGNLMIPCGVGELASGLIGEGRMAEPEEIVEKLVAYLNVKSPLKGKKVTVTAGPTYELLDPVRFIGNFSSGKMGFEIASRAQELGAEVVLITGPTALELEANSSIQRKDVISAQDMLEACQKEYESSDIFIMSAAVADYRPKVQESQLNTLKTKT